MSAIKATFSDFKLIKTRKVAQLVMEVPIEQADDAVKALGGLPTFAEEQWVGIAPLKPEAASKPAPKQSDRWGDLPAVKQAAIRCQDEGFQRWLVAGTGFDATAENAATRVRSLCKVSSRKQICEGNEFALSKWQNIDTAYRAHAGMR
jgi:hypothetical protein